MTEIKYQYQIINIKVDNEIKEPERGDYYSSIFKKMAFKRNKTKVADNIYVQIGSSPFESSKGDFFSIMDTY